MIDTRKLAAVCGAASLALIVFSGAARADGYEVSAPAAPREEGRKFTWSVNMDGTSDYIFRGISQTDNDPTIQGGIDVSYGIIYAGWWASGLDFDVFLNDAEVEMDWYGGIRPVWHDITFDFGSIYYSYPGASYFVTGGPQLNYWELKAGLSGNIHKDWVAGLNVYWSPDYFNETGRAWTIEGNSAYTFHKVGFFTPVLSGVLGYQDGNSNAYLIANGFSNYWYWNAGLALVVDNLTFDFRYWGTDASNANSDTLSCINHYCDGRFVFMTKIALP
ncbi:MAG: hypothetical protein JW741_03240 [Sedimentisphaerales bacterium]|nr:hypothetical protein [Sedimentisphaerales bacterium]